MPELPEVETTRRGLAPHVENRAISKVIVRNPSLRWPVPEDLEDHILKRKLLKLERRGKYLLFEFTQGTMIVHLGMSGSMRVLPSATAPEKHDHVDLCFGKHCIRFNDPRRFGCILWTTEAIEKHKLIAHLGPEPLTDAFDADYLFQRSRKRKQAIKTFIMDSRIVVGVGNIYANEALFNSGIHPLKAAAKLSHKQSEKLCAEIKQVLNYAIQRGGTTLRDFVGGDGKPGYFAQELNVYGRGGKPCPKCEKKLTEKKLGQRSTVYCTVCQR
jgi:formamidopyrimidine-DNA glycosylase